MKIPLEELRKCYLFKELSDSELAAIAAIGKSEVYNQESTVFREGEVPQALYLIHYGSIKTEAWGPGGHEQPFSFLGNGATFGESAFVAHQPRITHAVAMERTEVFYFPFSALEGIFAENPSMALKFFRALSLHLGRVLHNCILEISRLREEVVNHHHHHHR